MHLTICSWIFVLLHEVYATEINTLLLKEKNELGRDFSVN